MFNIQEMKNFSNSPQLKDLNFRKEALRRLKEHIIKYRQEIHQALYEDLGKSETEAEMTEIQLVLNEINLFLNHLDSWAKRKKVRTSPMHFYARSYRYYESYGIVLIVSPWNYPFHLCLMPLVGAIGAGNTILLKPSSKAFQSAKIIQTIVEESFDPCHVSVAYGHGVNEKIMEESFDFIFFTGGTETGQKFYQKAAEDMVPVILELGGKSPAIIHPSTDWEVTAQRIVFGKLINGGQTCVAVDYCLCPQEKVEYLIRLLQEKAKSFYPNPLHNKDYPKIISRKAYDHLVEGLEQEGIPYQGDPSKQKLAPVFFRGHPTSVFMKEEIFGPILPIIGYEEFDEIKTIVETNTPPLSLYVFSKDASFQEKIIGEIKYGGGCVNDSLIHISNHNLPFGGFHQSGIGQYHGKQSFLAFSHEKSILKKSFFPEITLRYPPFSSKKADFIRRFFK